MKIFLYGTLADPAGLSRCAGRPIRATAIPATLPGYRRVRLRFTRYPTLRRAPRHTVPGVIMRINANMLTRLQNYESARYHRIRVRLQTPAGPTTALCFIGDAATKIGWQPPPNNQIIALRSRYF